MDWSKTRLVAEFNDLGNACDIAEHIEDRYGFDACTVSLGGAHSMTGGTLYINTTNPKHAEAFAYAERLIAAARVGLEAFIAETKRSEP